MIGVEKPMGTGGAIHGGAEDGFQSANPTGIGMMSATPHASEQKPNLFEF